MSDYTSFLAGKRLIVPPSGFDATTLHPQMFDFQRALCRWALRRGRAAVFAGTGLGKSLIALTWAREVCGRTGGRVLVLAPLAVAHQTVREGEKFGIAVTYAHDHHEAGDGITITNYDRLHLFDAGAFDGVVLDESSIIKHHSGAMRTALIESFARTPYRLACTATPAPNDFEELGNHAEFLGVMSRTEMLASFFIHDGGSTQDWRLKGHAERPFWEWVASWAVMLRHPRDLGFEADGYDLPPLNVHREVLEAVPAEGMLIAVEARTLQEQRAARRASMAERVQRCADRVNATPGHWVIWCDLNAEGDALTAAIPGAVQVAGSDPPEVKERRLIEFSEGRSRVMVSKTSIAGFGLNWQHCHQMAFVGVSHSWESYYQAIRRSWRFGQTSPVDVWVYLSEAELRVLANLERKEADAERMYAGMMQHMDAAMRGALTGTTRMTDVYSPGVPMRLPAWMGASL